ncbi:hypothetical protein GOBAR_DD32792 [Gossypium barbadense]|nr:hypothetical protein GOBAR_DD32792 [Gossypium barbadense]
MAGNGLPSLGRVKLTDLVPSEGIPSDSYKLSVSTLSQSFAQYSAAIIQFPASDGALLRSGLDSARLYFQQKAAYPPEELIHTNDSREWCKTSGYYADPQLWQEMYDYRPGLTPTDPINGMEFPPGGLPDRFGLLVLSERRSPKMIAHVRQVFKALKLSACWDLSRQVVVGHIEMIQEIQLGETWRDFTI